MTRYLHSIKCLGCHHTATPEDLLSGEAGTLFVREFQEAHSEHGPESAPLRGPMVQINEVDESWTGWEEWRK